MNNAFKLIVLIMCYVIASIGIAQSSPVSMLENAANQILSTLKANKATLKNNPTIIYSAVERYLVPYVDVEGMSRSVLGRQIWTKATAAQKSQFAKAFTQLVIRTYASPLTQYTDETIQFLPIRGALSGRFVRVNSVIVRSQGQNIPLSYSLVNKNGQWKIYDISVEGVSLLQSFKSQFAQALQNSNIDQLINQMTHTKKAS